jgi:heat shock protein HslJ
MKKLLYSFLVLSVALLSFSSGSAQKKGRNKNSSLAGTDWKLVYAGNTPYNPPPGVRLVSMMLNDSSKNISGFLGCNNLAGSYMLFGKDGITFTVVSTKKACTPDAMRIESELATALNDANKYKIDGDKLALFKDDTFVAAFAAQKQ